MFLLGNIILLPMVGYYTNRFVSELPTLEIKVESDRHRLTNHGAQEDVEGYAREIWRQSAGTMVEEPRPDGRILGKYLGMTFGGFTDHHIMYEKGLDPYTTTYVAGHEEGHALQALGGQQELYRRLKVQGLDTSMLRKTKPFQDCTTFEKEYFANIAGMYALEKNGINVERYMRNFLRHSHAEALPEAYADFMKAKRSGGTLEDAVEDYEMPTISKPVASYEPQVVHQPAYYAPIIERVFDYVQSMIDQYAGPLQKPLYNLMDTIRQYVMPAAQPQLGYAGNNY
jgi:hypothetical protein